MARISTAFVEFRALLARHVRELEQAYPERYSTTWFFLRYLKRVQRQAEGPTPRACDRATRGLVRFYCDMADSEQALAERFDEVYFAHRNAVLLEQRAERRGTRRA